MMKNTISVLLCLCGTAVACGGATNDTGVKHDGEPGASGGKASTTGGRAGAGGATGGTATGDGGDGGDGGANSGGLSPGGAGGAEAGGAGTGGVDTGGVDTGGAGGMGTGGASTGGDGPTIPAVPGVPLRLTSMPARPEWHPEFPLDSPESATPFCSEVVGYLSSNIFSTKDAVYLLVSSRCGPYDDVPCNTPVSDQTMTRTLYRNEGMGWKKTFQAVGHAPSSLSAALAGYDDGRIIILDGASACQVDLIDPDGSESCLIGGNFIPTTGSVAANGDLFVLGYYVNAPTGDAGVLKRYRNGEWTDVYHFAELTDVAMSFAATTRLAMAGAKQTVLTGALADGKLTPLADVPSGNYTGVWPYGDSDTVISDHRGNLAHFDGTTWKVTATGLDAGFPAIWGTPDGVIYAAGSEGMGRFEKDSFTVLDKRAGQTFTSVWGNDANDVYFTVNDPTFAKYACGTLFAVHYDGKAFHLL